MMGRGTQGKRLWRPVVGLLAAYAVAIQTIVAGFAGLIAPANADETTSLFELCHGAPDTGTPAGVPAHNGQVHCIFCAVGAHSALAGPPTVAIGRIDIAIATFRWPAYSARNVLLSPHSIASPRGPPSGA